MNGLYLLKISIVDVQPHEVHCNLLAVSSLNLQNSLQKISGPFFIKLSSYR